MPSPEHLGSLGCLIASWVTAFTSEHQLAGLGLEQWLVLRLGWVPCTWARPVVLSVPCSMVVQVGLCLSPSALSLLGQCCGLVLPCLWVSEEPHELSQVPELCCDPGVFLQE